MKVINYILKRGNKILLQKRDNKPDIICPGELAIPGGAVDNGEDLIDACLREVKEETGIDVKSIDYLCDHKYSWGVESRYFIVEGDGEVVSNEGKMLWYDLKDLENIKLADNQNEIIRKL